MKGIVSVWTVVAALVAAPLVFAQAAGSSNQVRRFTFDQGDDVAGWSLKGDVSLDPTRGRENGSLKVSPGGTALLKLGDSDASGRVDLWVYDDGSIPPDPKAHRPGPRWGVIDANGNVLAVGVLYADYLGGAEGYTATACKLDGAGRIDSGDWFNQLSWLAVNRAPRGWREWTFDFSATGGLSILCNGRDVNADLMRFDSSKSGLKGFSSLAIWGDSGAGAGQTIWVDDVAVTRGGPVTIVPPRELDPYDQNAINATPLRPQTVYTAANAPETPKELPMKTSVSEYGITWTFAQPAQVGQFINGDSYVVGPVTITDINPRPLYGAEIPDAELDHMDRERPVAERVRNGFMLNPPARMKVSYDSGVRNWFEPALIQKLPVSMKPGDSLVSTISMPKGLVLHAQLRNKIERGVEDSSPIRTAAVLTCVSKPQPPDAFRPAFCDRDQKIYLARNLRRDLLPRLAPTTSIPNVRQYIRFTERPWVGTCFFGFEEPVENMPQYGLEYGRVSGIAALLLCTSLPDQVNEPLLVNYVQIGIDLGGMVRAGHPGWTGWGGHGSGRKLPIVFAGLLLGDDQLANINRSFPAVSFGEDEQTAYGKGWTGATVVFAGHSGIDAATGAGRSRGNGWGPYEQIPPAQWKDGQKTSENYRRCCTSVGWVAEALALRLMHAESAWHHDAFFDYVDRWMYEDDSHFVQVLKQETGNDYSSDWARQGQTWDAFVNEMWKQYRPGLAAPTDGWKRPHDDSAYLAAIQKEQ